MFSEMAREYLENCEYRCQPNTVRYKFQFLREFADFVQEDMPVQKISESLANGYILHCFKKHGAIGANRRLREMKTCWNRNARRVALNPWGFIENYAETNAKRPVPSMYDVEMVLKEADAFQYQFVVFLAQTGARLTEALNLKRWEVSFERKHVALKTRKTHRRTEETRYLPLNSSVLEILDEIFSADDSEFVFTNPKTRDRYYKHEHDIKLMLPRLCQKAGVAPFGFHGLRHFFANTLMASGKAVITDIQQLLGHKDIRTTMRYLGVSNPKLREVVSVMDNFMPVPDYNGKQAPFQTGDGEDCLGIGPKRKGGESMDE